MTKAIQKITLSSSRDIPFDKLVLSQSNVRHVKAGISIEELAEDIARRGLLMGLSVRAVIDEAGVETGVYEIPAGGRRYRALAVLVKQKRLARNAGALRRADRRPGRGRQPCREHPARGAPPARPIPRLPSAARERPVRRGDWLTRWWLPGPSRASDCD